MDMTAIKSAYENAYFAKNGAFPTVTPIGKLFRVTTRTGTCDYTAKDMANVTRGLVSLTKRMLA